MCPARRKNVLSKLSNTSNKPMHSDTLSDVSTIAVFLRRSLPKSAVCAAHRQRPRGLKAIQCERRNTQRETVSDFACQKRNLRCGPTVVGAGDQHVTGARRPCAR